MPLKMSKIPKKLYKISLYVLFLVQMGCHIVVTSYHLILTKLIMTSFWLKIFTCLLSISCVHCVPNYDFVMLNFDHQLKSFFCNSEFWHITWEREEKRDMSHHFIVSISSFDSPSEGLVAVCHRYIWSGVLTCRK